MPIKRDKKQSLLYIFREIILNDEKIDNHSFGKSVMKAVDAESFPNKKRHQRKRQEKNDDFDTEIL